MSFKTILSHPLCSPPSLLALRRRRRGRCSSPSSTSTSSRPTDGSIWKGVIVEQTPGVQYKIATADGSLHVLKAGDVTKLSKQKNRDYRGTVATADR